MDLGICIVILLFIVIYSINLYFLIIVLEEIIVGIEDLMGFFNKFNLFIIEISLILILFLRFIFLVLEEI